MKLNILFSLCFIFACTDTSAEISTEIFCFTENKDRSPINFEMRTTYNSITKKKYGYVKYKNSSSKIPIKFISVTSNNQSGNQLERTQKWVEKLNEQYNGTYYLDFHGYYIDLTYINKRNKQYDFSINSGVDFSAKDGCLW